MPFQMDRTLLCLGGAGGFPRRRYRFVLRLVRSPGKKRIWNTSVPVPPGRYEYRYLVDGQRCAECVPNPYGGENDVSRGNVLG
jgi:hypothetical protein